MIDRILEKVVWGRPFKEKLVKTHVPNLNTPVGIAKVRRGIEAFDSGIKELKKWTFVLEMSVGCFYVKLVDVEVLLDQIKFTCQNLNCRYRLPAQKMKLHIFDAKGEYFVACEFEMAPLGRGWSLELRYKITA